MIGTIFPAGNTFVVVITSYSDGINFKDQNTFKLINFIIIDGITILYFYSFYKK